MRPPATPTAQRLGRLLCASLVAACSAPSGELVDSGHAVERDANCDQDGTPFCLRDVGLDARPGLIDTGPPLAPIFPVGAWIGGVGFTAESLVDVTIVLDARPTAGVVRGIFGNDGASTSIELDVLDGGAWLLGRSSIRVITNPDGDCGGPGIEIRAPELRFTDEDGDGTFETLDRFGSYGGVWAVPDLGEPYEIGGLAVAPRPIPDARAPTLELVPARPLLTTELLVLRASEPIDVSFSPRLVGPVTFPLVADVGSSAPARWTLDARALPPGHYVLELGPARDVVGNEAVGLPTFEVDVAESAVPPIDDVDPRVVSVQAEGGTLVVGDDVGEIPIVGATSICGIGRTVVALDVGAGHRMLDFTLRVEATRDARAATAMPFYSVFDPEGRRIYHQIAFIGLGEPPGVPAFDQSSIAFGVNVPFEASRGGRYTLVIFPEGYDLPTTCGTSADPAVRAVTLDAIRLH